MNARQSSKLKGIKAADKLGAFWDVVMGRTPESKDKSVVELSTNDGRKHAKS